MLTRVLVPNSSDWRLTPDPISPHISSFVAAFPDQIDGDVRQALRSQHLPPQGIGPLPDATQQLRIGHLLPLGDEAGNLGDIHLGLRLLVLIHGYLQGDSSGDQDTDSIGFNYRVP